MAIGGADMAIMNKERFEEEIKKLIEQQKEEIGEYHQKGRFLKTLEKPCCPQCGSEKVYGISRVVGYFSVIDNWNPAKQDELLKRQKGDYDFTKEKSKKIMKQIWKEEQ